eukprot:724116-Amorphochlora_amoeboformis.AAC.1
MNSDSEVNSATHMVMRAHMIVTSGHMSVTSVTSRSVTVFSEAYTTRYYPVLSGTTGHRPGNLRAIPWISSDLPL